VEANGMEYLNLRLGFQPLRTGRADRILAALTEESRQPVFMHCQLDRDRMSALVAAYRVQIQGWDIATAEAEAKQFGLRPRFVGLRRFVRAGGARE
jgi:protein tyrosine/serine phosphatase